VTPRLLRPAKAAKAPKVQAPADSWEGVHRGLFDELRRLRHEIAAAQNVPAYIVFGDAALRDMARRRPSTPQGFRQVKGVGDKKLGDYGQVFVDRIVAYCRGNEVPMDVSSEMVGGATPQTLRATPGPRISAAQAFPLFREGLRVEQVAQRLGRAASTVHGYLAEFIRQNKITDPSPWVDAATVQRVTQAAEQVGTEGLKPIFERLDGQVSHDQIRIVVACMNQAGRS
jgi:ATP-dependent DNA helicase RecQ